MFRRLIIDSRVLSTHTSDRTIEDMQARGAALNFLVKGQW